MNQFLKWNFAFIISVAFPILVWGQQPISGLVPKFYSSNPAIDLVYNGENLDPELAHEMEISNQIDISTLDPDDTTNLWSKEEKVKDDSIIESTSNEVHYQSKLMSRIGIFRFSAITENKEVVNFSFGKKIHNFLLRKNLLRKLGYNVPKIQYIKNVKINFESSIDRDIFISDLTDQAMADSSRFIASKTETSLTLIDGVVMKNQSLIYNMALGTFPKNLVGGRRTIRAAYLPLALVDLPESINMMPWQAGRIILENIKLFHGQDLVNSYGPSYEDAKWIVRKIGKLTRSDWTSIIKEAYFPKSVELLLIEKIISRRNHLLELFLTENPLDFNPMISYSNKLKEGELLVESFEGYVDRYSFGDPESPFSIDEMSYFFLSKGISTGITNAISQINSLPFMAVNEQDKIQEHMQKIYQGKGAFYEAPLKAWFFPTAKGQVIISRDIVTGSYMGTNNQVQLVDTVGGYADAGVFMGIDGLEDIANVSAKSTVQYQRTYSHVKPIKSLKKALKEPFKNMVVPMVLKHLGNPINANGNDLQISSVVNKLKKALGVGESFIITDSLGGSLSLDANMSVSSLMWLDPNLLKAYAQLKKSKMVIRRIHITRTDKNTIQIYHDNAKSNKLAFIFKLNSYIPILNIGKSWNKAKAKVDFYSISLNDSPAKLKLSLKALKSVLVQSRVNHLKLMQTPFKVVHSFKEKVNNNNLLIWEKNKIKSFDQISITHPKGGTKSFYRQYNAKTTGRDIEGFAFETISNLVNILWNQNIFINQTNLMNPGFTIFGKAKNEIVVSEANRVEKGIKSIFTQVKILKNGWKSKKHKLIKLIKNMNKKYGKELFKDTDLQNTKSVLLYQLGIEFYISEQGYSKLLNISELNLKKILKETNDGDTNESKSIMYLIKKVKLNMKNYPKFALEKSNKLISKLVNICNIDQLKEIFGNKGVLITAKLEGFRQGDEMGDSSLISNTYGYIKNISSPLSNIIEKTKIAKGELLLNWMMERAL
jgi:hypothetical protein